MPRARLAIAQNDLFAEPEGPATIVIAPEVMLLRQFVATEPLVALIVRIAEAAPFRRLHTPGGGQMSVAMTNCGAVGWHADASGYRYVDCDPKSGQPWPAMPEEFAALATAATTTAGFGDFAPDCCLINRYAVGTQMGTHRDFDELDLRQPIVSVSLGLPAVFVWRGTTRNGPPLAVRVVDGDVIVWGGRARAGYHGVRRLPAPADGTTDQFRYNLTFRRAR